MTITFSGARAFRHRNYRLFFGGQAISLVGTWMQQVAQGWLVLQLTHEGDRFVVRKPAHSHRSWLRFSLPSRRTVGDAAPGAPDDRLAPEQHSSPGIGGLSNRAASPESSAGSPVRES